MQDKSVKQEDTKPENPSQNTFNSQDVFEELGMEEISNEELAELQPVDIAEYLQELPITMASEILSQLPIDIATEAIATRLFKNIPELFLSLPNNVAVEVMRRLRTDERVFIFRNLVSSKGETQKAIEEKLLTKLPDDMQTELENFLRYPITSVASIMTTEFSFVSPTMNIASAKKLIQKQQRQVRTREVYDVYVLEKDDVGSGDRRLVGVVSLKDMLIADDETLIEDIMQQDPISVLPTEERFEAAALVSKYNLLSIPVVTHDGRLLGIVTVDDIIDVITQEETIDFLRFGAVQARETDKPYFDNSIWIGVRNRVVWLLFLFIGGTLTSNVVQYFQGRFDETVILTLSAFIALLVGTGGNIGSQTVSTIIRSLAINEIETSDWFKVLARESATGFVLGLVLFPISYVFVFVLKGDWHLSLAVSTSVIGVCTWSSSIASQIPILAQKVGLDPTVLSAPLITTLVDATGLIIYFSIAKVILAF
ncbi:MAG: magnesium transporter [Chloroherpetonaceae bacterium]|nr:magnesium transporter [Chloroherpetonaceae bacterium]